ncbi:hypothetical protein ANANG_G00202320 [Anguilla anguilla]|uniref:Uncharacterized protein n=1 Tax=Anguilla anguilla TaxID=7936 RepID=A0A9D3RQI1_ANGAN|nr:hypothetical protein ANANG_G00202320 [Anguilla anguilla]
MLPVLYAESAQGYLPAFCSRHTHRIPHETFPTFAFIRVSISEHRVEHRGELLGDALQGSGSSEMSSSPAHQLPSTLWRRRRRKRRSGEQAAPVDPPKPPRNPPETPTVGTACSLAIATRERSGMADLDRHVGVASERKTEIGRIGEGVAGVSPPSATCFSSAPPRRFLPCPPARQSQTLARKLKRGLYQTHRDTAGTQRLPEGSRVPFVRLERLRMPPASGRLLVSQISTERSRHNGPHPDPELPPEGAVSPEPARSCTSQAHRRKITIAIPVPVSLPFVSLRRIQQV